MMTEIMLLFPVVRLSSCANYLLRFGFWFGLQCSCLAGAKSAHLQLLLQLVSVTFGFSVCSNFLLGFYISSYPFLACVSPLLVLIWCGS